MLRLILENRELELDENIQFAITRQFEDITNPTTIINDWSKTVRIPSTPNNDKIFGHIFSVDKTIVKGSNKLGIYFNPYKKIDFRLVDDSNVILTGYAKNISVDKDYYNLTLNGELGKVFQEMKKITFDTKTEDTKYLIDGSKYVKEQINKDLIWELWRSGSGLDTTLRTRDERDYRLEEIIGFAPNNSYSENFDYKTFQNSETQSKKFSEVLDVKAGGKYEDVTGIAADTVISNGLLPREIGEYRSYLQQPYIFFNKLFQIFIKRSEELTGYKTYLSPIWFSNDNPYWSQLVFVLNNLNSGEDKKEKYSTSMPNRLLGDFTYNSGTGYTPSLITPNWIEVKNNSAMNALKQQFQNGVFDRITIHQKLPVTLLLQSVMNTTTSSLATRNYVTFGPSYKMYIQYRVKDENGRVVFEDKPNVLNGGDNEPNRIDVSGGIPKVYDGRYSLDFDIDLNVVVDRGQVGNDFTIEVGVWSNDVAGNDVYFLQIDNPQQGDVERVRPLSISITTQDSAVIELTTSSAKRSYSLFTLNDLWNNEYSLFDTILNYCKMFRIGVFTDYYNKELKFIPLSEYFKDFTIEDWTDKVDYSRDFHIEPITFQNRYILFNYNIPQDLELNSIYKNKNGLNYGEFKLTTDYEFNNDTNSLFDKIPAAIPNTDTLLSWSNLYDNLSITYTVPAEISVDNKNKDKKQISNFGSLLFYKGLTQFDTTSNLRNVKLTDDTLLQINNDTYFYTQAGQDDRYIDISTYPLLDISLGNNLSTYTTPKENYTYDKDNYSNGLGIYKNFWEEYLDERYNIQNKIVTCYVYLKPNEFADFKFNKFVKINNQLYFVNKIYDYDIDATTPTKVDLITVQDIEGYTKNEFRIFNIYYKNGDNYELWNDRIHYIDLDPHTSNAIYITSNTDITWRTDQGIQNNLEVNGEVVSGRIQAGNKVPVTLYNEEYGPVEGYVEFSNGRDIQKIFVRVR